MSLFSLWLVVPLLLVRNADGYEVLIAGGGFGGVYSALQLARLRPQTEITLVDSRSRFCFLPLLYEYACGLASEDEVSAPYESIFASTPNVRIMQGEVTAIERDRFLIDGDEVRGYSAALLALGKEPQPIEGALSFYRLEDARLIRENLRPDMSIAVIGGGYTGVELASNLAAKCKKVTLLHRSSRILAAASDHSRQVAQAALKSSGAEFLVGEVTNIQTSDNPDQSVITLSDGQILNGYDMVIATVGAKLADPLSPLASGQSDNRISVDSGLRLSSSVMRKKFPPSEKLSRSPTLFALGDAARLPGSQADLAPSAQVTLQQALIAARNIAATLDGRPLTPFRYLPLGELVTLGQNDASASLLPTLQSELLNLQGPVAGLARRLVYAVRMPTPEQRLTSLRGLAAASSSSATSK